MQQNLKQMIIKPKPASYDDIFNILWVIPISKFSIWFCKIDLSLIIDGSSGTSRHYLRGNPINWQNILSNLINRKRNMINQKRDRKG